MTKFKVVNINRRGEVFDPADVTIHAGDVPGLEFSLRELAEKINNASKGM